MNLPASSYNELSRTLSYDLGHVSMPEEVSRLPNGSTFFRPRNPNKLDYDPEKVMREAVDFELVPGPAWDIITDSKTGTVSCGIMRTRKKESTRGVPSKSKTFLGQQVEKYLSLR